DDASARKLETTASCTSVPLTTGVASIGGAVPGVEDQPRPLGGSFAGPAISLCLTRKRSALFPPRAPKHGPGRTIPANDTTGTVRPSQAMTARSSRRTGRGRPHHPELFLPRFTLSGRPANWMELAPQLLSPSPTGGSMEILGTRKRF